MRYFKTSLVAVSVMFGLAGAAQAETLDFGGLGLGDAGTVVNLGNVTLTATTLGGFAVPDPAANGICFTNAAKSSCEGDGILDFNYAVDSLSFELAVFNPGDSVVISAFNGATMVTESLFEANATFDLSSFGTITRLVFDDSSTGAGFAYQNFSFERVAAVPLPAGMGLLAGALGVAGFVARRKKRHA